MRAWVIISRDGNERNGTTPGVTMNSSGERARDMAGAVLPGDSTVELRRFEVPTPGHGEVLLRVKSSTICGSDIRCIYRQHLGKGPEGYQPGLIAGHEPAGQIVQAGPGCRRFKQGDRVIVYHISGCGVCNDCRRGYMISCTSPWRRAYGWQRHGGMAEYMLAEEKDLAALPDSLTYSDGAQVACGFGTVYEGLERIGVCGSDDVLITGLGPVGLATAMLARALGAHKIIGIDALPERQQLAKQLGLCDVALAAGPENVRQVRELTGGHGVERAIDCSANDAARLACIQATRKWGKICFLGEGGTVSFKPSEDIIHDQKTIYGSWVTTIWRMEELVERIVRWGIHPERLITHRFPLERVSEAYQLMASGRCGKVAVVFDEEVR
jgi:threonine dehydrogenase-like Zn-dependent dehydrogenase